MKLNIFAAAAALMLTLSSCGPELQTVEVKADPPTASEQGGLEGVALVVNNQTVNRAGRVQCTARASGTDAVFTFQDGVLVHYYWSGGYTNPSPITEPGKFVIGTSTFTNIKVADNGRTLKGWWAQSNYKNWLTAVCDRPVGRLAVLQ